MNTPAYRQRLLAAMTTALLAPAAHAIDMDALNAGKEFAGQMNTTNPATTTAPADVVPNYNPNPPQTAYAGNPSAMNADAAAELGANPASTYITDSMNNRPLIVIDPTTDPLITSGQAAVDNANVLIGQYQGCQPVTQPTPGAVTEKLCHEYAPTQTLTCDKTLAVDVQATAVSNCTPTYAASVASYRVLSEGIVGRDGFTISAYCQPDRQDNLQRFYRSHENGGAGDIDLPITPYVPISNVHLAIPPSGMTLVGGDSSVDPLIPPAAQWTNPGADPRLDKVYLGPTGDGVYGLYYTGGCDASGNCQFAFYEIPDALVSIGTTCEWLCALVPPNNLTYCNIYCLDYQTGMDVHFRADIAFQRPKTTWNYTVSEAWVNGCAALEARAQ